MRLKGWNVVIDDSGTVVAVQKRFKTKIVFFKEKNIIVIEYENMKKGFRRSISIQTFNFTNKYNNLALKFAECLTSEEKNDKKFLTFALKFVNIIL